MARYQSRAHHNLARYNRLNVRFIRRHFAKTIKRDERGFYYSNADNPPARFYFKTWREAAADLSVEIGITDQERTSVTRTSRIKPLLTPHGLAVAERDMLGRQV
jgi:hypothetical protein